MVVRPDFRTPRLICKEVRKQLLIYVALRNVGVW